MPRIRRVLVDITGMLTIPKGRREIPHGHGRDIFCNKKKKTQFQRRALLMDCARKRVPTKNLQERRREKKIESEREISRLSLFSSLVDILRLQKMFQIIKRFHRLFLCNFNPFYPELFDTSPESD